MNRRLLLALVGATVAVGVAIRAVIYGSSLGRLDIDEPTWALMARHFFHQPTAFFWSASYSGTQEVIPLAFLFAVFGTHLFLVRLVTVAIGALCSIVVWRIGRRTIGELPAVTAGLLLWVWPPYEIWRNEVWNGYYASGLAWSTVILLLTLQLDESPSRRRVAVMGLVLGLALWQSPHTVTVIVPSLLWLTLRRPRVWLDVWVALPGFVIGLLPSILSNLRHDWWSFSEPGEGIPVTYLTRLHGFVTCTFPMLLGLRVPYSTDWLLGPAMSGALYLAAVVALAVVLWRGRRSQLSLFALVFALYPFLYATSGLTSSTWTPRYVLMLAPIVALLVAKAATTLPRAGIILALAAANSVGGLTQWNDWTHTPGADFNFDQVGPAVAALDRAGIDRAYSDYKVAYTIMFDTRERIIVSETDLARLRAVGPKRVLPPVPTNPSEHHWPAYDATVRASARHAYILVRGEHGAAEDAVLLRAHGYSEQDLGRLLVFISS